MKVQLSSAVRLILLGGTFLCGCRAAHNVAVSSFRVIDAPANYVRRHIDNEEATTTTTTTTSDVVTPGQPVVASPPTQQRSTTQRHASSEADREKSETSRDNEAERSHASSQETATSTSSAKIPYAKPVPGKPGYVYSPFDRDGGIVDVTGYASGSKAKDPYSGKIFIVP